MLFKNGINLNTIAEIPKSNDPRQSVTFGNNSFIKKDNRVGFETQFDFLINGEDVIAEAGTRPRFNLIKSFTSAGTHRLERKDNAIFCDNVKLLDQGKCLIVELNGAGGGGCGGHRLDNGSGGGAGGYCCVLLDFTKHRIFDISLGTGGNGVKGTLQGNTGGAGGRSSITASGIEICRGDGGQGGRGHHGADGGNGFIGSGVIGFAHWGHSGAQEEQDGHIEGFAITGITPFNEPTINRGNFQSKGKGNNTGGGGGCSALAKGGDGGTRANGQNGTLGSGGGGGGGAKGGGTTGGRGADGVLYIYY